MGADLFGYEMGLYSYSLDGTIVDYECGVNTNIDYNVEICINLKKLLEKE
jgi:hypothetical protein